MSEVFAVGVGLVGAFTGLIVGFFLAKRMGLTPSTREYKIAYEELEQRYKEMNSRWRGRIKEYDQPSELQQMANSGAAGDDLVTMLINNIGGMKSVPSWLG